MISFPFVFSQPEVYVRFLIAGGTHIFQSQHCCAKRLINFKLCATAPNNTTQHATG
ncbi:unnamed protein product [Porites evermanni]|uniref:Uncharacterized protein n=1 Tax=Porites evermanni TaxID=104178 RepID=A0ABN8S755_9CNID|nr:unnamed protein product [Porites evermanni]